MASMRGGAPIGAPIPSRVRADARSKRKPSTWYSVTQWRRESRMREETTGWLALTVLPQPLRRKRGEGGEGRGWVGPARAATTPATHVPPSRPSHVMLTRGVGAPGSCM